MNRFSNYINERVSSTLITTMDSENAMGGANLLTTVNINLADKSAAGQYRDELDAALKGLTDKWYPNQKGE